MTVAQPKLRIALLVVALAAAGAMTASMAHGDDPPTTASFKTVDGVDVFQRIQGSGSSTSADIVTGGTVTFTNSSVETHNVDFGAPGQIGVSCQQTAGGTSSALTFPSLPTAGSWAGMCTFTRAGTYSFMCDHHAGMTGTVVVHDPAGPPAATTAPTPTATTPVETLPAGGSTTTPTTTAPPSATNMQTPSAEETPVANATALSVRVKLVQRGSSVRGTIGGARSSARVRIALTAQRGAIGLTGRAAAAVGVGSIGALTTQNGTLAFVVKLDSRARAALAKRGRLAVTLLVTAPPVTGTATRRTFTIVLRPRSR